ncbi:hypothetical protein AB3U99_20240 [Niallia sp. JL1B1071]|uniref:hypothetical protein n=1 Tax=Niallia tiangongensis TaxID=3237105 RepID=UPI0037DC5A29
MGAARKSETLQERERRSGSALAPWKAKCIQDADNNTIFTETAFINQYKPEQSYGNIVWLFGFIYGWNTYVPASFFGRKITVF